MGVKAVSYYRDGSRDGQVLTAVTNDQKPAESAATEANADTVENQPAIVAISVDRIKRPVELVGSTWRIPFDAQNLYVTVNHDGARILEVFATGGGMSVSVGFLASKMLRGGFDPAEVAASLNKVIGSHSIWFNHRLCTSPEQVIAECILITERRLAGLPASAKGISVTEVASPVTVSASTTGKIVSQCKECKGNAIEYTGGCYTCRDCGWSKCA
jgi:ribonucleoside-diphosphate reductase alpha chain